MEQRPPAATRHLDGHALSGRGHGCDHTGLFGRRRRALVHGRRPHRLGSAAGRSLEPHARWGATTVLSFAGLGFLAWRAGDPSVLNPIDYLAGFLSKGRGPIAACVPENYSPVALLCRLGVEPSTTITIAVAAAVLLIGWLLIRHLTDSPEARWEVFAVACLLSGMLGPIDWASYGVLMAPLFLLLAYQFWRESAPPPLWIGVGPPVPLAGAGWGPPGNLAPPPVPPVGFFFTPRP